MSGSSGARGELPRASDAMAPGRFGAWLTGVGALALLIQLRFIDASAHLPLSSAAAAARVQASWLVRGFWFVDPSHLDPTYPARSVSALHPPITTLLLAVADVASATGVTAQRVFFALIFVGAIVVGALCARALAGGRAGILAALVLATFPALWVNPVTLGPETAVVGLSCLVLWASVRFADHPSTGGAAEIGAYLGLCVLTRTDLVALVVLVGLPLAVFARSASWLERGKFVVVLLAVVVLVVAPWAGRNLATFSRTTLVSNDTGAVLAGANCATTYAGPLEGWWSAGCADAAASGGNQPAVAAEQLAAGRHYASSHEAPLVSVAAERVGRLWGVVDPIAGARLEALTGRPVWVTELATWYLYLLVPTAVFGAVVLRRRRLLLFPFAAMIVLATLTAALAYGDARFRVEADAAMAILAGVALDSLWRRIERTAGQTRSPGQPRGRHAAGSAPRAVEHESPVRPAAGVVAAREGR